MIVLENTIQPKFKIQSDPGDYPSGGGAGPLPAKEIIDEVVGIITIGLNEIDLRLDKDELNDMVVGLLDVEMRPFDDILKVTKWSLKRKKNVLEYWVKEFKQK